MYRYVIWWIQIHMSILSNRRIYSWRYLKSPQRYNFHSTQSIYKAMHYFIMYKLSTLDQFFSILEIITITFSNTTKKGVICLTRYAKIHNEQAVNPLCMSIKCSIIKIHFSLFIITLLTYHLHVKLTHCKELW